MKQALHLKIGQHLTMTPQLQQAIRLLQLSALELQTEIQEALESNPLLETIEDGGDEESNPSQNSNEEGKESNSSDDSLIMEQQSIPDDLPVDTAWDDIYEPVATSSGSSSSEFDPRDLDIPDSANGESLHEQLIWQTAMAYFSETDRRIAEAIIDSIDDTGYLKTAIEDIQQGLNNQQANTQDEDSEIELDEVEAVLHRIQNFDPPGVGARDLQECLSLQLRQLTSETDCLEQATELVNEHFELLANRDYTQLMRRMKINEEELKEVLHVVESLQPRPGSQLAGEKPEYIIPEVIVKKVKGRWQVSLNPDAMPKIRINSHYAGMINNGASKADNKFIKSYQQEAKWFIDSLNSRNETLLKVSSCIVERQQGFLEHGDEAMKALVLRDIAEEVEMHESTISRVTTRKYMYTPRGIFELKYFFSSHVMTASGGECSSTAIRALIKKLIAAETPNKPLSDSKIATILEEQGINVARRTVAKYREAMNIPPSNERKRLA